MYRANNTQIEEILVIGAPLELLVKTKISFSLKFCPNLVSNLEMYKFDLFNQILLNLIDISNAFNDISQCYLSYLTSFISY